jgi:hypothetical protein
MIIEDKREESHTKHAEFTAQPRAATKNRT